MDYEKKYKEALKKAKESYHRFEGKTVHYDLVKLDLEDMFSELKESEDKKWRSWLIGHLQGYKNTTTPQYSEACDKAIAWLEKQGEQKLTDKVEPKFKVGDYVVGKYISGYISEVRDDCYLLDYQGFSIDKQDNYHLWTIQDAKEGDVLADKYNNIGIFQKRKGKCWYSHIYLGCDGGLRGLSNGGSHIQTDTRPATKEQRDLLFAKMKEAGYEWDAEKKELKKIHVIDEGKDEIDYCFTKMMKGEKVTPAWSEEDEELLSMLIDLVEYKEESMEAKVEFIAWLKSLKGRVQSQTQPKQDWSEEDERLWHSCIAHIEDELEQIRNDKYGHSEIISDLKESCRERVKWLKSLKDRVQPQNIVYYNPYKEVVESIVEMCKHYDKASHSGLRDFYDNVKVKCKDAKEYDSLFPQNTWKPSDEQMKQLGWIAEQNKDNMIGKELMTLYNDLKKLKE